MILDKETLLASAVAVTDAAKIGGTVVDLVKAGSHYRPHGFVVVQTPVAFVAAEEGEGVTPGTHVTFELVCADNAALDSNPVVVASSGAIPVAALTKEKTVYVFNFPNSLPKQYFGIQATPTGEFSAGKFTAFVTMDVPKSYAVS